MRRAELPAKEAIGHPPSAGLAGTVAFRDVDSIPFFEFAADVKHPFAEEARAGVTPERSRGRGLTAGLDCAP